MQNPYQTLGVPRDATADEIKRAYRKLASKHHPDRGGDTRTFQDIQTAYDTLSDPSRRNAYDNPGFGGMNSGFGFRADAPFDFQTIFDIFGTRFQQPGQQHQQRRQQARMSLWITLRDVALGERKMITVGTQQGTQAVEIEIPPGINDGDTVQYSGLGPGGMDLLVTYRIHPDPRFQRRDLDLYSEHTVTVWDLILGCDTQIRDLLGNTLILNVPPRTQPGTMLRLRGRGLPAKAGSAGDLLIRIQATIPAEIDAELLAHIEQNRHQ